jgi:23S rRNA (cytosine1962-C5)-methyltransferase
MPTAPAADLATPIRAAWQRREALHGHTDLDTYRLLHGACEELPGLEIDRYGEALLLRHAAGLKPRLAEVIAALDTCREFPLIFAAVPGQLPVSLRGAPPAGPLVVHEAGLRFAVTPWRRGNPGLFLDARPARGWIRTHSEGRTVLNLFAWSGSLGVAAAAGGACRVTHVDSQAAALEECQRNHALNGSELDARDCVRVNIYQHLRRNVMQRRRFDAIILDPPPLSRFTRRSDRSPGGRGLAALAPLVAPMLAPGGWLLCLCHEPAAAHEAVERQLLALTGELLQPLWRGAPALDFPACGDLPATGCLAFARR